MPDRSALISRLAALPEAGLALVENAILRAEAAIPATPGATRVVGGATIMDLPDLMPLGTAVIGGPAPSGEPARAGRGGAGRGDEAMRLSSNPGDPGLPAFEAVRARGEYAHVYLNGVEISDVHTADEEGRFLLRAKRDEEGHLMLNDARDAIVEERLEGDVAIVLRPGP